MSQSEEIVLRLNHYQAANLCWLVQVAYCCPSNEYPSLNTGDWAGEILPMLEQAMIEADCTTLPNAQDEWARRPILGECMGKKRHDYEREAALERIDRAKRLLSLQKTARGDKVRLASEALAGWWGREHSQALERG